MKEKAAAVGEKIRSVRSLSPRICSSKITDIPLCQQEDGVRDAIKSIYMYMERARKDRTTL